MPERSDRPEIARWLDVVARYLCAGPAKKAAVCEPVDNPELVQWLRRATKGLCAAARQRIYCEVVAHHADAVEHAPSRSDSDGKAHQMALGNLGDPEAAAEAFQRLYLTAEEAEKLEQHATAYATFRWKLRHRVGLMVLAAPMVAFWSWRYPLPAALLMDALFLVMLFVGIVLVPRLWRSGQPRRAALWEVLSIAALFAGGVILEDCSLHYAVFQLGILAVIVSQSYSLRLFLKLVRPATIIDLDTAQEVTP